MVLLDVENAIIEWTDWANKNKRYDIALLKIWIKLERFISDLFIIYATGNTSEKNYKPELLLQFTDESQLNALLREGSKAYIDYPSKVKTLSKYIFKDNPFEVLTADLEISNAYSQIIAIRNYVAHESGDAKAKLIKACFGNDEVKYRDPNAFLQTKVKNKKCDYYTYYIEIIRIIINTLVEPL